MDNQVTINYYRQKIEEIFLSFGFEKIIIRGKMNYEHNGKYRRIDYHPALGFIVEYAESLQDAQQNLYEDGDLYPLSLEENLIAYFKEDVIKYML